MLLPDDLAERLLDRGDHVVVVDNLVTGSVDNITHLFGREGFSFQRHDVSTAQALATLHNRGALGAYQSRLDADDARAS